MAAILASFVVSLILFFDVKANGAMAVNPLFTFIKTQTLTIDFAFQVDQLSSLFLLIITGIGFLDSRLFCILYARRRATTFRKIFCLFKLVRFLNVIAGFRSKLCNNVYWLGRSGALFLFINWILV